jgi:hypothetical protein
MIDPLTNGRQGVGGTEQVSGAQADLARRIGRSNRTGALITSIPKWAAYAIIAWQATISIEAMSGKRGFASLLERFGRQASYWEVVCWIAGLLGVLSGLYSRQLLRKHLARDASRLDALERRLTAALAPSPGSLQSASSSTPE